MSGDVQPRKRKDKRRRKDELSVEEPRGTAAVFGEGDVFMHSQHEHGTGGHWCAKVIFFSLLAVLVTLIGLIILENRGLSELEANSVESRYSGVLEGWLEDTPDDDHHDEHTLELKHHDEDDDEHGDITDEEHDDHDNGGDDDHPNEDDDEAEEGSDEIDEDDEDDRQNDDEIDENDEENDSRDDDDDNEDRDQDDDDDDDDDGEQNVNSADNEDDEDERNFQKYYKNVQEQDVDDDDDDDDDEDNDSRDNDGDDDDYHEDLKNDETDAIEDDDDNDDEQQEDASNEIDDNKSSEDNNLNDEDENDQQQEDDDDDEDQRDEESNEYEESYGKRQNEEDKDEDDLEEDVGMEVEKIEKEISDEDVLEEATASNIEEEDKSAEQSDEDTTEEDQTVDEEEFLEPEDIEEPVVVERITAPAGKPLPEVEEEASSEKPPDTLAEEEEYEKQQEEIRRQKEQASHVWLKVAVGGALLVATHAVIRRATAPRDSTLNREHASREETPSAIDRRMTLIPEEPFIVTEEPEDIPPSTIVKEVEKVSTTMTKSVPLSSEKSEEEEEELEFETKNVEDTKLDIDDEHKELYSDDEIDEEVEEEMEVEKAPPQQVILETEANIEEHKDVAKATELEVEADEEVPEDVEIIDDEQLEEELVEEEEEDEEDISDVDDAELLSRLEAKYGRLPEPERPAPKKDGGNSLEDEWPGEPSEQYWRQQLDEAERELRQGSWGAAAERAGAGELRGSARARLVRARALDAAAEARRDNTLLSQSIAAYLELLKMNERLSDKKLLEITNRTLDRIRFRGNYMNAEPVYRLLIRRFPNESGYRNNLTIAFLMANRADLAEEVLKETLRRWPDDRVALAHLGFIYKTSHNKLEEAVDAMRKALEGDIGAANEPRFYFHLGDALLLLGRYEEANEVHKRGAKLGHFLSPSQRSLYNVERLKSRPWWDIELTPYLRLARALEASWKTILKEGEAARALYEQEKEGLKERGEWSQLDLFVRGQEIPGRCKKAPITCSIVRQEIAAVGCKRGQIKFSAMDAGTHVRPHVGPTNCRLRMHLGLSNTKDTYLRVDKETRQWQPGKVLMFDDSFEHEVWHNGTGTRLVLIVDVWHPDLTPAERRQLPAI